MPISDARAARSGVSPVTDPGWVQHAIWWQIYPLGFVGAFPAEPPPAADEHRLLRIVEWLDHAVELGVSGVALGPVFASRTHGYDTTDHLRIDPRLGDDGDFDELISECRQRGLRVLLDGVFNHVGTDFPRYRAALANGPDDWFRRHRNGFATFEGHGELIALNHENPEVVAYTIEVMDHWLGRGADGWRLDAAYAVAPSFWAAVLPEVRRRYPEAWFVGEVIHGDYPALLQAGTLDSLTQYELWKAIWSSLNDANFHELDWALQRHNEFLDTFVPLTFIGNHDVSRIASQLDDARHLEHALVLLLTTGGTPSIYAGDEWAWRGVKEERAGGDDAVRPEFSRPQPGPHDTLSLHQYLIGLRRRNPWLHTATTEALQLTNTGYVYRTRAGDRALVVALNIDDKPLSAQLTAAGRIIAGSGAPPTERVQQLVVPPHGWVIVEPG